MQLDWFTVLAQIVNFLILVYLLKRFLYRPIINAMDTRESHIAARLAEAEDKRREAEGEIQEFERKTRTLEQERERLLEDARLEADAQRKAALEAARREVDETRRGWNRAVEQEKEQFLVELRRQLSRGVCDASRQVLSDLADASLEEQVTDVFLRRLRELPGPERQALAQSCRAESADAVVSSAFVIPDNKKQVLRSALKELLGEAVAVRFRQQPELICGIELETPAQRVEWSADSYLEQLRAGLDVALDARVTSPDPAPDLRQPGRA